MTIPSFARTWASASMSKKARSQISIKPVNLLGPKTGVDVFNRKSKAYTYIHKASYGRGFVSWSGKVGRSNGIGIGKHHATLPAALNQAFKHTVSVKKSAAGKASRAGKRQAAVRGTGMVRVKAHTMRKAGKTVRVKGFTRKRSKR